MNISKANVLEAIREVPGITLEGLMGYFKVCKRNQEEKVKASVGKLLVTREIEKREQLSNAYALMDPLISALNGIKPFVEGHYICKSEVY